MGYQHSQIDELNVQASKLLRTAPDSSMVLLNKSLALARKDKYTWGMATALNLRGRLLMITRKDVEAFETMHEALEAYGLAGDAALNSEYIIYRNLASILLRNREFEKALSYYDSSFTKLTKYIKQNPKEAAKKGRDKSMTDLLYFKSLAAKRSGNLNGALDILNELWELTENLDSQNKPYGRVLNQLGLINKDIGNYEDSRYYFKQILELGSPLTSDKAFALHNYGYIFMLEKKYNEADSYLEKALSTWLELIKSKSYSKIINEGLFKTRLDLGESYFHQKKYQEAIAQWQAALSLELNIQNDPELFIIHSWSQQTYMLFDTEKANHHGSLYREQLSKFLAIKTAVASKFEGQAFRLKIEGRSIEEAHATELLKQRRALYLQLILATLGAAVMLFGLFKLSEKYRHRRFHSTMHGIATKNKKD